MSSHQIVVALYHDGKMITPVIDALIKFRDGPNGCKVGWLAGDIEDHTPPSYAQIWITVFSGKQKDIDACMKIVNETLNGCDYKCWQV